MHLGMQPLLFHYAGNSTENQTQAHGKLKGCTFLDIYNLLHVRLDVVNDQLSDMPGTW